MIGLLAPNKRKQRLVVIDAVLRRAAVLQHGKTVAAEREIIVDGDAVAFRRLDGRAVELHRGGVDMLAVGLGRIP